MNKQATQALIDKGHHVVLWYPNKSAPRWKNHLNRKATVDDLAALIGEFDVSIVPIAHVVVDLDVKDGRDGVRKLRELVGDLPATLTTTTPSGGKHLWFKYLGDLTSVNCGDGIEFKRKTGTAHVPPSKGYTWSVRTDPIQLPDCLLDLWRSHRSSTVRLIQQPTFDTGLRHDSLKIFAAIARKELHLSSEELRGLLHEVNQLRCVPPTRCEEVDRIVDWAITLEPDGLEVGAIVREPMKIFLAQLTYG